jgi:DNA-3-methyladenine glycosylase
METDSRWIRRGRKLGRSFYTREDTLLVARELLGKRLVVPSASGERVSGIIVETEGYMGPEDRAAHSFGGRRTARTETMYARGGTVYVFLVYGLHHQFNVVAGAEGVPHAVLVRALEPDEGIDIMRARRGLEDARRLTSGPGKLCQALALDRSHDGEDLTGGRVWIEDVGRAVGPREVARGPRVGIDYAGEYVTRPWRFWLKGSPFVSRKA